MTQEKVSSLVYGHAPSLETPYTKMQYICRLQSTLRVLRKCGWGKHVNYVAKANIPTSETQGQWVQALVAVMSGIRLGRQASSTV